ncbi:uncharacterized protein C5L36_0A12630 [Pichia kudriavzevii]|uniref:J domain-containing protein n=2 Tax=Pichia kudriavzevii TaxID=4909 RepID=A0A099P7A0_PICKU|nr:uncharacterized protein C5L36_0A12630 [Pichia kudriavzevii]AWU74687.1 hypothetical protein C5L36_0A12630 [Pichia kudriavzevii]KGK40805.1 hypothetical protein JL09_g231 [Pichia kudriavzevii]
MIFYSQYQRNHSMLPLIVGLAVTVAALTTKATINTVIRCRTLTNFEIARLNGITLKRHKIWPSDSGYWRRFHELDQEMALGGFLEKMDAEEAMNVLGVKTINVAEIRKRHRVLMMQNHPDKGGSKYLAMKINLAKDILLNQR